MSRGVLKEENSLILSWRQRSAAIDVVGLSQLRTLNNVPAANTDRTVLAAALKQPDVHQWNAFDTP